MFVPCEKAQCGILGREAFGSSNSVCINIDGDAIDSLHARRVHVCMCACRVQVVIEFPYTDVFQVACTTGPAL